MYIEKKKKRRHLVALVATVLLFAFILTGGLYLHEENIFLDVQDDAWYAESLQYAVDNNIIQKTYSVVFFPDAGITRGEFVYFLGNALDVQPTHVGSCFKDVESYRYYAPYIYWALENGFAMETSVNTFSPDEVISRHDAEAMMRIAMGSCSNRESGAVTVALLTSGPLGLDGNAPLTRAEGIAILVNSLRSTPVQLDAAATQNEETIEIDFEWPAEKLEAMSRLRLPETNSETTQEVSGVEENSEPLAEEAAENDDAAPSAEPTAIIPAPIQSEAVETDENAAVAERTEQEEIEKFRENLIYKVQTEMSSRSGMLGRLYIPDADISVAIFPEGSDSQAVVDAKDSAVSIMRNGSYLIGDHDYQGFSNTKSVVAGYSYAYFVDGTTIQTYICKDAGVGSRTSGDIFTSTGTSVFNFYDGFSTYTCNGAWTCIYYTIWEKIKP